MPKSTTLGMTLDELTAERRALSQVIEKRKDTFDKAIHKQDIIEREKEIERRYGLTVDEDRGNHVSE